MRTRRPTLSTLPLALLSALALAACTNEASTEPGDVPPDAGTPSALGSGLRIAQMNTPGSPLAPANDQLNVYATGATYLVTDTYAETGLAASVGAVYLQDFHGPDAAAAPYSGIQLYKPTYEPASLTLGAGDVVDFTGEYQVFYSVPEMYEPIVTFRFDYSPPAPTPIDIADLETDISAPGAAGAKWLSMLVVVTGTVGGGWNEGSKQGECYVYLTSNTSQTTGVAMDNELFPLDCSSPMYNPPDAGTAGGVRFKSVTGIVTNDFNFRISPRSAADIVLAD